MLGLVRTLEVALPLPLPPLTYLPPLGQEGEEALGGPVPGGGGGKAQGP